MAQTPFAVASATDSFSVFDSACSVTGSSIDV